MVALALFAATLAVAGYAEDPQAWDRPPPEVVRHIETAIVMPPGAARIERYDRFYGVDWNGGRPVVVGTFVERRPEQSEGETYRLFDPPAFAIEGGGCRVVNLVYSVEDDAAPELRCNAESAAEPASPRPRTRRSEPQVVEIPPRR